MTSIERTESALAAIAGRNAATNAFILVDAEGARAQARAADEERRRGIDRGPLHGAVVSIKDLIDMKGLATTAGSRALEHHVAAADAPVVRRLRDAGAVLIGKTNLHEFALGTTSEDSGWGPTRHPQDASRSPGGSSGGSAVSVVTGMSQMSVGTDTGGSIRIPASVCGIVGLKPSVGDVPTTGVIPLSSTFDHVGPLTRTVADAAAMWRVLAARPGDVASEPSPDAVRLRVLGGYFSQPTEPAITAAFERALDALRRAGVGTSTVEIANTRSILETYVAVVLSEAAAWHSPLIDERGALYRPTVRARLLAGRDIAATTYIKALEACRAYRDAIDAALAGVDALVLPTLPITAPVLGQDDVAVAGASVPVRSAMLRQTQLFNMTGHPAISLPMPMPSGVLPCGFQIVGRRGKTAALLAIAAACEKIIC